MVREISDLARNNLDEVRRLATGLFPVKIEQNGLEWALEELATGTTARSHTKCSFIMRPLITFKDQYAAVQLFRIAQEAVSNAVRHGKARNVILELTANNGTVNLSICDDGAGLSATSANSGLGLHTMKYRARSLGGSLEISSEAGRGTTVICSVPVKELVHAE